MSGAPSKGQQSERELKTARTLNTVATIGAGHALYATVPKETRAKIPGRKRLVAAGWMNEPTAHPKKPLPPKVARLMPKAGTSAKIAAGAGTAGWLTLHGGELVGDVMARRSINSQLENATKNKGKVKTVEKNDQSMISKADGSVSGNGHGKALDATGAVAVPAGAAAFYQAGKLNAKAKRATASATKYQRSSQEGKAKMEAARRIAQKKADKAFANGFPDGQGMHPETKKWVARSEEHGMQSSSDATKARKMSDIARQLKSGRNKYAAGGAVLIGGTGIERAYNAKKVEKAQRRFDPEADRQRRIGMYSTGGVGLGLLAADRATRNFTTDVGRTAEGKKIRGIAVKPGHGKKGALLSLAAIGSGAAGVGTYRHGLSVRNQPWT